MGTVPWWAGATSVAAPALLIGGWTVAAARQPDGYDSLTSTISALAGRAATNRWIMTVGLAGLGLAYVLTALGLRPAAAAGRIALAAGGLATIGVSALPLPATGPSTAHGVAAAIGFVTLAVWPALSGRRAGPAPWPAALRMPVATGASGVLLVLIGWFAVALHAGVDAGLAERVAAGAESLWPLAVTVSALRQRRGDVAGEGGTGPARQLSGV